MKVMLSVAVLAALLVALAGCKGDVKKPTFPVSGKVTLDGKPAKGAQVFFHPVAPSGPDDIRPRGRVANDGTLEVTTYTANDGAPAGEYKLSVELWLSPGADAPPANQLPAILAKPETSGLTVTVNQEPTTLKNIELKR